MKVPVCFSSRRRLLLLAVAALATASAVTADSPPGPVAIVDGTPISAEALESAVQAPLVELRLREDMIRRQALDELIDRALVEKEAKARGVSVEGLERTEISEKARVSAEQAKAFYDANKARFGTMSEAEALDQIRSGLGEQRQRERRTAFARELRARYGVKVLLEPFRVPVDVGDAPVRGNPAAPVTVVEFSDFQCPYCARARPAVNQVREVYGDEVRIVFRHFPLGFHTQAPKAGEAAVCAGEQGRFWEMHDRMFAQPGRLAVPDLKEHAASLGLDTRAFDQCLDSGRHAGLVERDTAAGARYGVSGTPAFFINGRPLVGAQPFEAFARVIDDELERLGRAGRKGEKSGSGGQ
jgi:predicted DsbA family dithiol-disulfide isomerase